MVVSEVTRKVTPFQVSATGFIENLRISCSRPGRSRVVSSLKPSAPSWPRWPRPPLFASRSFASRRLASPASRPLFRTSADVRTASDRVGAPFENRRFSGGSGFVSIRSKFRERSFDAAKRFRSSNRAENAREAPFFANLAIDRFRTARERLFFASSSTPFHFRSTIEAPFREIVSFPRSRPLLRVVSTSEGDLSTQRRPFFVREVPNSLSGSVFVGDVIAKSAILHAVSHVIYRFRLLSSPSSPFFLRFRTSKLFYRFIGSDIRKFQRFSNPSDVLFAPVLSIRLNVVSRGQTSLQWWLISPLERVWGTSLIFLCAARRSGMMSFGSGDNPISSGLHAGEESAAGDLCVQIDRALPGRYL